MVKTISCSSNRASVWGRKKRKVRICKLKMVQPTSGLPPSLSLFLLMVYSKAEKMTCEEGKEISPCRAHCPATCDNLTPMCTFDCRSGCVCKKGTVADNTGKCVKKRSLLHRGEHYIFQMWQ
ncbi:hypothetical protein GDO81_021864 [Engystomops pustulosus]|uniref:TIL domain-containing protein n=1 Tax=Engystomops pustulosus TaxID=76066 RepID=A0AAV6Z752_ENGPU|nr:hypothetical protein GDO81_021864 [Engystomops pustulosus]